MFRERAPGAVTGSHPATSIAVRSGPFEAAQDRLVEGPSHGQRWLRQAEPERQGASRLQTRRRAFQLAFFALFLLAPALDLLRFDLTETQLWFLGQRWSLGIGEFMAGRITATEAALSIVLRAFVPAIVLVVAFLAVAWRWGRLYCGWLCPHFSVVELLNDLLHRAIGRFSVWERKPVARGGRVPQRRLGVVFALACVLMGALWAITLLSYLLPPARLWSHLLQGALTPGEARFLAVATLAFTLEFAFARHLFCRFGCAVGLFQSLAWMANPRGMVVAFARERARDCKSCDPPTGSACDRACPMRLNPRNIKRMMFSCVQCARCVDACETSMAKQLSPGRSQDSCAPPRGAVAVLGERGPASHAQRQPLLQWSVGEDALRETLRQRRAEIDAQARSAA